MANEMQGISALDPRVAATDQFISEKQIPPDQVPAFLMQMGADPRMVGLVFKYQRLKDAAAKQQGPAPTSTVAQDVDQQYAQMQGGLGSLPAPVMENAQFQGGIAPDQEAPPQTMAGGGIVAFSNGGTSRLPAVIDVTPEGQGVVNRQMIPYETPVDTSRSSTPSAASGGIRGVLSRGIGAAARFPFKHPFMTAGLLAAGFLLTPEEEAAVQQAQVDPEGLTDEQRALLAELDKKQPPQAAGGMEMPERPEFRGGDTSILDQAITDYLKDKPKSREESIAQQRAIEEEVGETKAIQARRAKVEEQIEKGKVSDEKRFWLAFAQAGFAASAKGARNLWETLSMGGEEGMKAYQAMKDKEEKTRERLEDKLLQLDSMNAAIERGVLTRGDAEFKQIQRDVLELRKAQQQQATIIAESENRFGLGMYTADMQAAIAKMSRTQRQEAAANLEKQYTADTLAAQKTTDPKLRKAYEQRAAETLQALQALAKADPSVVRAVEVDRLQRQFTQGGPGGGAGDGFGGMTAE